MKSHSGDTASDLPELPPWLEVPDDWPTVPQDTLDRAVGTCLAALSLDGPDPVHERLIRYYDPSSGNAGATFLALPTREPDEVTAADLLATTLLGVSFRPADVRRLLDPGEARD